jgi:hypothetical protein
MIQQIINVFPGLHPGLVRYLHARMTRRLKKAPLDKAFDID